MTYTIKGLLIRITLFSTYWLMICQLPKHVLSPELDPSWAGALSYFAGKHFQFGTDIIFTFGPLGYIYSNFYSGYLLTEKVLWELLLKGVIAFQLTMVSIRAGTFFGALFLYLTFILSHEQQDYLFNFSITLALMTIVESVNRRWRLLGWLAFLGILSLIKFSFLVMSGLGLLSIAIFLAIAGNWKSSAFIVSSYALLVLAHWALAGQNLIAFHYYLSSGFQIASGYQHSMFLDSDGSVLRVAVAMLGASAILLIGLIFCGNRDLKSYLIAVAIAQSIFMNWKQGFIRADFYHFIQFYFYIPLISISAWAVFKSSLSWLHQRILSIILVIGLLLPFTGIISGGGYYWLNPFISPAWQAIQHNISSFADFRAYRSSIHAQLQLAKAKHTIPKIRSIVGGQSIDVFGFEQGIALLNDFNYRPRPVFQSYSAYNQFLVEANRHYYLGDHAPKYVLLKLQSIDGRIPVADDSAALEVIRFNYIPVAAERGYLLMQRPDASRIDSPRHIFKDQSAYFNENIAVPNDIGRLWIEINWDLSWRQKLQALVYQPDEIKIELTYDHGSKRLYKLTRPLVAAGFQISPMFEDTYDILESLNRRSEKAVNSFRLVAPENGSYSQFHYKLYAAAEIPSRSYSPDDALKQLR